MVNPKTVNELMEEAAKALINKDVETLENLLSISEQWLQDNDSKHAQFVLLDSMIESIYEFRGI